MIHVDGGACGGGSGEPGTPDPRSSGRAVPFVGYPIRERTCTGAHTAPRRHRHLPRIGPITINMGGITMHSQRERHGYSYVSVRRMCNTKGEQEP